MLPEIPQLPDDDPILALRMFREYLRELANSVQPYRLLIASVLVPILVFLLAWWIIGFGSALSWASDLVPLTFAVISVVVSVKRLRDEHQTVVIVFVLVLGFLGTLILHLGRSRADFAHNVEIKDLRNRMDTVRDQQGELLTAFLKKPALTSQQAEMERRANIQQVLRGEYIISHDNVSPGLLAGTEFPPSDWMNKRLAELGEKWKVHEKPQETKQPIIQQVAAPQEQAHVVFTLWPTNKASFPLLVQTLPVHDEKVDVSLSFEVHDHEAKDLRVWMRLCEHCSYATEPSRFSKLDGILVPTERVMVVGNFLPNSIYSPITTFTVAVPPLPYQAFTVALDYGCENCEPPDFDTNGQLLTIRLER